MNTITATLFALLILTQCVTSFDLIHCGGFIKPSSLLKSYAPKMDYSDIFKVNLVTRQNQVIYTTSPAPNGYYIVPIYEVGNYAIQIVGPDGWYFSPNKVDVIVDDDTDANSCDGNDFILSGFRFESNVGIDNACDIVDKSGIIVKLDSSLEDAPPSQVVTTDANGSFSFQNVFPDMYTLSAHHPSWSFGADSVPLDFNWDNLVLKDSFTISGFSISGKVVESNNPVVNVNFLLYSDTVDHIEGCENQEFNMKNIERPLCITTSNDKGEFIFSNVTCGEYTIVPIYTDDITTFDVVPKVKKVNVKQGSVELTDTFTVKGFSVRGRVLGYNEEGIPGVTITAAGIELPSISDNDGYYTLVQVTSGDYTLVAKKPHYSFTSISKVKITPSVSVLPDINIKTLELCGTVQIPTPPAGIKASNRKIVLLDERGVEKTTMTDNSGHYCFEVLPGQFTVSVEVKQKEVEAGLSFLDTTLEIDISLEPVTNAHFEQTRYSVSGTVQCISSPCDTSISLSLVSLSRDERVTSGLVPQSSGNEGHFIFNDALPGKYEIRIEYSNWCWKENSVQIQVVEDYKGITFVQSGYNLKFESSHENDVQFILNGKELDVHHLKKGTSKICVEEAGKYTFVPKSCYLYPDASLEYSTKDPHVIELTAQKFQVVGSILLDSSLEKIPLKLSDKETIYAKKTADSTYQYEYWLAQGEELVVVPEVAGNFFYPSKLVVKITNNDCPASVQNIEGRPGLYLEGNISPSVSGAQVSVFFKGTNKAALSPVLTDKDGNYRIGPLYDDKKYDIIAEKAGFYLKAVGEGNFKSLKLGQVTVTVTDTEGNPVQNVFLSLSGDGYRNNNSTKQDGIFDFEELYPGDYYLKPLLKEYDFTPESKIVEITDGEDLNIQFIATRYAYSCFGSVKSLTGIPEKFVVVEAVGPNNNYEETKTDENGEYRLRGLVPGMTYTVSVKDSSHPNNAEIGHVTPRSRIIEVEKDDIHNMRFVSFGKRTTFDLSGRVDTDPKYLSSVEVTVIRASNKEVVDTQIVGPTNMFLFPEMPIGKYIIKTTSTLDKSEFVYNTTHQDVDLNGNVLIEISFPVSLYMIDTDYAPSSVYGLIFGVTLVILGMNYEYILAFIKKRKTPEKSHKGSWTDPVSLSHRRKK